MANHEAPKQATAPQTITLDTDQLNAMIAAAVAEAMKKQVQAPQPPLDMMELAKAIGSSVAFGIEQNAPPKKVTIGQYIRRGGNSPFHPKPAKDTPSLKRHCFQNGVRLNESTLYDREIELLNKLTHSGRYINRLVEVVVTDNGSDTEVDIRFNNSTASHQIELKGEVKDFRDMLRQIYEAQELERAEMNEVEERKTQARRKFGDTKAFREAQERAAQV